MVFCVTNAVLLAALACVATDAAKLPSNFKRCSKADPKVNECLRINIEDAFGKLKEGSKQLGLTRFEPLDIPELKIGQGKGPVNVEQHFTDVQLHGLTESKVLSVDMDFENRVLRATSLTPELRLQAHYTMKGRILLLPIVGEGPCNVTLSSLKIDHILAAEPKEKNDKAYWFFKNYTITLIPEKVIFKFDNLFDGDKQLGHQINMVINENWSEVFADVRKGYEEGLGMIFKDLANRVFGRVAVEDIFLE